MMKLNALNGNKAISINKQKQNNERFFCLKEVVFQPYKNGCVSQKVQQKHFVSFTLATSSTADVTAGENDKKTTGSGRRLTFF